MTTPPQTPLTPLRDPLANVATAHALRTTIRRETATLRTLCAPRLTDTRHIEAIVQAVRVTARPRGRHVGNGLTDYQATVAIGCLLALYSPAALIGDQIRPLFRAKIAAAIRRSQSFVSIKKGSLFFLYNHDHQLKADIDRILNHTDHITMHTYTNSLTLYVTANADGTKTIWDKPPYRDEAAGQWVGEEGTFISCQPCPALDEALFPLIAKAQWTGEPITIHLTATIE